MNERELRSIDEAGLERSNQFLRNIRSSLARKTGPDVNLVDTLGRMWIASDPLVNKVFFLSFCTYCPTVGH